MLLEDMHAIGQGQLHATHGKKPRAFALLRFLCPAWREGLASVTKGAPKEEDGTDSDVGTEGTPST